MFCLALYFENEEVLVRLGGPSFEKYQTGKQHFSALYLQAQPNLVERCTLACYEKYVQGRGMQGPMGSVHNTLVIIRRNSDLRTRNRRVSEMERAGQCRICCCCGI